MTAIIREKLAQLLTVEIFVTTMLTTVFSYLTIIGKVDTSDFMTVFMVVITFYFAKDKNTQQIEKPKEQQKN